MQLQLRMVNVPVWLGSSLCIILKQHIFWLEDVCSAVHTAVTAMCRHRPNSLTIWTCNSFINGHIIMGITSTIIPHKLQRPSSNIIIWNSHIRCHHRGLRLMGSNGDMAKCSISRRTDRDRFIKCDVVSCSRSLIRPHHFKASWCCKSIRFDCLDSYAIGRTWVRANCNIPPKSTCRRALPPCDMKNPNVLHFHGPLRFSQYYRFGKQWVLLMRVVLLTFQQVGGSWLCWVGGKCYEGSRVYAGATPDVSIGIEGHVPLSSRTMIFPDHFRNIVPIPLSLVT